MKKQLQKVLGFILIGIIGMMFTTNTYALENTIKIGISSDVTPYIADVHAVKMPIVGGGYAYCTEVAKISPSNVVEKLVREADMGITYILLNGYPKRNITGNADYDYYITQTAIWWYLDELNGTNNLSLLFKTDGKDEFKLRPYIKKLVNGAKDFKANGYVSGSLELVAKDNGLTLSSDRKYYETIIEPKFVNVVGTYNVSTNSNKIIITDLNNISKNTFNVTENFKIRIANGEYDATKFRVTVTAKNTYEKAFEYNSENNAIQSVVILQPIAEEITSAIELAMQPTCENGGITSGCEEEIEIAVIPDTNTNTTFYIVGIIILMSGALYAYYYAKIK